MATQEERISTLEAEATALRAEVDNLKLKDKRKTRRVRKLFRWIEPIVDSIQQVGVIAPIALQKTIERYKKHGLSKAERAELEGDDP